MDVQTILLNIYAEQENVKIEIERSNQNGINQSTKDN